MANIKIAQLTNQTSLSDTDLMIVESATSTNKMTVGVLKQQLLKPEVVSLKGAYAMTVPTSQWQSVELTSVLSDTSGLFNILNGTIVIKKTGWYQISATVAFGGVASSNSYTLGLKIIKNSTITIGNSYNNISDAKHQRDVQYSNLVYLNAGDFFALQAYQNSGGNLDLLITDTLPILSVLKVG